MVKTPKMRHSKPRREPVTIDLDPGEVSRVDDAVQAEDTAADPAIHETQPADPAPEPVTAQEPTDDINTFAGADTAYSAAAAPDYTFHDNEPVSEKPMTDETSDSARQGRKPAEESWASSPREETSYGQPAAPAPRRGGVGAIAAGLIGGVIALAGAGGLQYAGLLGVPGSGSGAVSLDGVNAEIAGLKTELAALKDGGGTGDLSAALDQVKADVVALKSAVESGGAGDGAGVAALSDKLTALETTVASLGQGSGSADLGPVNEKLAALDALVKSAGDAATAQQDKLAALEQSVSQLAAKVDAQAAQPKIALAIAASALKSALDRGASFSAELDTFAAIAPDAPELATLRTYAEKGVPNRADIAAGMEAAANAMIAASQPVDDNAGFFERLLSSAESLVKIRPIGAVEGKGVPETVARMEVAVNQNDYAKALAEYDTLPEPAKAAGAEFAARLKARMEVETAVDALISGAMKA